MFGSISKFEHERLMEEGRHARATVIDARTLAIAGVPIRFTKLGRVRGGTNSVKVHLRVEPDGEPPFEVTQRVRFPEGTGREPGDELDVVFDPSDPQKLILDPDSWAGSKPRRS